MPSSERLAKVCGETNPLVINKFHCHHMTEPQSEEHLFHFFNDGWWRVSIAGAHVASDTVSTSTSSSFFCSSVPLGGSSSSSSSWPSESEHLGTFYLSWLPLPLVDELARLVLLVNVNLISTSNYVTGAQAVLSSATQAALVECYGLWPLVFFCCFKQLSNVLNCQHNSPCCLLLTKVHFLAKSPPSSPLAIARVSWV